jgi:hypothetical protein
MLKCQCGSSGNIGTRTHQRWRETRSIGSLIYKNLKLKKNEEKKGSNVAEEVLLCGYLIACPARGQVSAPGL